MQSNYTQWITRGVLKSVRGEAEAKAELGGNPCYLLAASFSVCKPDLCWLVSATEIPFAHCLWLRFL